MFTQTESSLHWQTGDGGSVRDNDVGQTANGDQLQGGLVDQDGRQRRNQGRRTHLKLGWEKSETWWARHQRCSAWVLLSLTVQHQHLHLFLWARVGKADALKVLHWSLQRYRTIRTCCFILCCSFSVAFTCFSDTLQYWPEKVGPCAERHCCREPGWSSLPPLTLLPILPKASYTDAHTHTHAQLMCFFSTEL